jgi:hypothetical protein
MFDWFTGRKRLAVMAHRVRVRLDRHYFISGLASWKWGR